MRDKEIQLKRIIVILCALIILLLIICSAYNQRANRVKTIADYDIKKEHYWLVEEKQYSYCPYCGKELRRADSN